MFIHGLDLKVYQSIIVYLNLRVSNVVPIWNPASDTLVPVVVWAQTHPNGSSSTCAHWSCHLVAPYLGKGQPGDANLILGIIHNSKKWAAIKLTMIYWRNEDQLTGGPPKVATSWGGLGVKSLHRRIPREITSHALGSNAHPRMYGWEFQEVRVSVFTHSFASTLFIFNC